MPCVAFDFAARESCLDGAGLEIHDIDGAGVCPSCGASVAKETTYDCCPQCGAHPFKMLRGMGMRIVELDGDSDDRHSLRFLFFRLLRQMRFVSIL
ncbi:hydrogenase maturation nickel metallochaperone HypA [Georgfuchsia toluolica]|uniref:hydrogenase/urease maturation nickel metallochaperone HypA n=1 Tax=Georgfuchsia toluolica TaxID=424218 RepID=UPI001C739CD2